jgi:predicted transcriptional regulator
MATLAGDDMSSQRAPKSVGDQELALLRYVSERQDATVGEAAAGFGQPRELARSTVLTMMERLRKKGYLGRRLVDGVYRYAPRSSPNAAVGRAVQSFVERALGGSISPFVAYLADREQLSDAELAELETALARLRRRRPSKD